VQVKVGSLHFPKVNEAQGMARARFQQAIKQLAAEQVQNVLVVTHGDAVGAIVELCLPHSTVYQVDTTGYVLLDRHRDGCMHVTDAAGVAWLE
jgi:broad specificity phosphatase PhoE